jgi:predicted RNase H-like nuclease (RuvC/YqgF family)
MADDDNNDQQDPQEIIRMLREQLQEREQREELLQEQLQQEREQREELQQENQRLRLAGLDGPGPVPPIVTAAAMSGAVSSLTASLNSPQVSSIGVSHPSIASNQATAGSSRAADDGAEQEGKNDSAN